MSSFFKKYPQSGQGIFLVFLFAVAVALLLNGNYLRHAERYPVQELNEGWVVARDGEVILDGALTDVRTGDVPRGTIFTLTRTLEEDDKLPSASLFFRSLHAAVKVCLDDEIIYTAAQEQYDAGRLVARLLCNVDLPADHGGRKLSIELKAGEPDAFYGLGPIFYGTEQDLTARFLADRRVAFVVAIFLCIFGLLQLFWMPLLLQDSNANFKLFFAALTTLVLGIYLMGYYNLFDIFTDIPNANTMLEYLAFYLIACVMSGYIASSMTGRVRKLYLGFFFFDICFIVTALVLHALNIVHFTRFILICYAISFSEAVPFMILVLRGWTRRQQQYYDRLEMLADRMLATGFFAYVIGSFTDAAIFSFVKFTGGQEATVYVPFVTAGSLVFSFAVCMHYFLHGVVNLRAESVREALRTQAYSDPLTGLANRGVCEDTLAQLTEEQRRFAIINLDLDHLKELNDSLGHVEGDRMLTGFADILRASFPKDALIGRTGGDEFIVVLTDNDCSRTEPLMQEMQVQINIANSREHNFQYSASYGIAQSDEFDAQLRAHDIYLLADRRMYDMKRIRHNAIAPEEEDCHA